MQSMCMDNSYGKEERMLLVELMAHGSWHAAAVRFSEEIKKKKAMEMEYFPSFPFSGSNGNGPKCHTDKDSLRKR